MRIAYADPPYPGTAHKYGRPEVKHDRLLAALETFDGWALSTTSTALKDILPLIKGPYRIGAFCKKFSTARPGTFPTYSWEPVIFNPARNIKAERWREGLKTELVRDFVVAGPAFGFLGAKPPEFCGWLFTILGMEPGDAFHDFFHGSGAVKRAWLQWAATATAGGPLFVRSAT